MRTVRWFLSSFLFLTGCAELFTPNLARAIGFIIWGLIFLPVSYSKIIKGYGLGKNYNRNKSIYGRIIIFLISPAIVSFIVPESQQASKPQTTPTQVVVQTPKVETPKPVVVSAEYKMFRAAGASPEKAQALKDACTADKTCPKTLEIAKAVVKGEITLGVVSKPDRPCTVAELEQENKSEGISNFCYFKSAEYKKAMREAEAANKAQEKNSSDNDSSTESVPSASPTGQEYQKQAVLAMAQKFVDEADTPEKVEALGENCRIMLESGTAKEKALCLGIASIYAGQ
jgi:hypothetical protein